MSIKVGSRFNPHRRFFCAMIPDPVMATSALSAGAKLAYGVLCRFAGENGNCFPSERLIGKRIGVSDRQVRNYVAELIANQYIESERGNRRKSNRYYFLWRSEFREHERDRKNSSSPDGKGRSARDGNDSSAEESQGKVSDVSEKYEDLDYPATNRTNRDSQPDPELAALSILIAEHLGEVPTQSMIGRVVAATPHHSAKEAIEAIETATIRGYGRNTKNGPQTGRWFDSVTRNYWSDRTRYGLTQQ